MCLALLFFSYPAFAASNITALWANDGEDKVTQDELRASLGTAGLVNTVWDGSQINLFGARNEVVSFNVILEAGGAGAGGVAVSFNRMSGPSGAVIAAAPTSGNGVFDWTQRPIELFYVRYLAIKGLSRVSYEIYDERHIPRRFRRPGSAGTWQDRPDHDKFYPDIAVPLELVPTFTIASKTNQSVWIDIYIPKGSPAGLYQGTLEVRENGTLTKSVPVRLKVYGFTLPDTPSAKTMLYYSSANLNHRYLGATWIDPNSAAGAKGKAIRDRHFLLAHRHRFSLIGDVDGGDCNSPGDRPCPEWGPRLDGSLFTASNGYDGPGVNTGNNVYSIDTYGSWTWKTGGQAAMNQHTDAWETWFKQNSPSTEHFLYLIDESTQPAQTETWANWILNNPGPGGRLKSMATIPLPTAAAGTPSLDIPTSTLGVGIASQWQPLVDTYTQDSRKRFFMYNGNRPATGSTGTDDDGVALRERAWAQYKLKVNRWFFWETTYYNEYQGGTGEINVFQSAHTFGSIASVDPVKGETGWNYSNGDGVLFYPGTDLLFPSDSYGVDGPFASLRLKHWRRGLQDVDYLTMAAAINPAAVQALVNAMVPKAAWENGVTSLADPTYILTDISWSDDPKVWENARAQLAAILSPAPVPVTLGAPTFNPPAVLGLDSQITATPPAGAAITAYNWAFVPSTPPAGLGTSPASGPTINIVTPSGNVALGTLGLSLGYYQISVTVTDNQGNVSPPATRGATVAAKALQARVYPNPWRANRNAGMPITFEQPILNFTVNILSNYSGRHVRTLTTTNGVVAWDLTGDSGSPVASGTYIYIITFAGNSTTRGRLAIIR